MFVGLGATVFLIVYCYFNVLVMAPIVVWIKIGLFYTAACVLYWFLCTPQGASRTNYSYHGNCLLLLFVTLLLLYSLYGIFNSVYSISEGLSLYKSAQIRQHALDNQLRDETIRLWHNSRLWPTSRSFEPKPGLYYGWYEPGFRYGDWHTCNRYIYNYVYTKGIANLDDLNSVDFVRFMRAQYPDVAPPFGYSNWENVDFRFNAFVNNLKNKHSLQVVLSPCVFNNTLCIPRRLIRISCQNTGLN